MAGGVRFFVVVEFMNSTVQDEPDGKRYEFDWLLARSPRIENGV